MTRRLVAVVMASLCTVLLGGAAPAARSTFDLTATAARLDALHISIRGGLDEHLAAELLNYDRIEGGIAECMRAHSRPYRKPVFLSFYRDFTEADFGYGNGSATIIDSLTAGTRRWELNVIAGARMALAGANDRGVRPADVGVLNGCAEPFEFRDYTDFDPPAGAYALASFGDLQESVYRDAEVVSAWRGYHACMKDRHGYVIGDDRSDFLFGPSAKLTDPPVDGAPAGPAWHPALAELTAVFAADVECRRPAYTAAMRVVADRLDGWEIRHRAELLSVREEWRRRVAASPVSPGRGTRLHPR